MLKRPLCMAALLFVGIQAVLAWGFIKVPKPGSLEQNIGPKEKAALEGTVCRREKRPDSQILYLKDNTVRIRNKIYHEPKLLVYVKTNNQIKIGNRIEIQGEAKTFEESRNPGNFDQKFYYRKQGIHMGIRAGKVKILDVGTYRIREGLAFIREKWKVLLTESMGPYYGSSMSAILLGDKSGLDQKLKAVFQKSGIGHILAISGLHMSFLGSGVYLLLRKAGAPFAVAGIVGICFLGAYTLMIGCGVSSIRAMVMFFVRTGADMTGRDYDRPTSLALAAAVIAAWQPVYLFDAGFLLSFGALSGITFVYPCMEFWTGRKPPMDAPLQIQDKNSRRSHLKRFAKVISENIYKGLLASLALNLALLPVMLYYYFEFPLYSIFLNLLIIPLMPVLLGAGIVGSITALSGLLSGLPVLSVCKAVLCLYEKTCIASLSLPGSRIVTGQPKLAAIYFYYAMLALFCLFTHTCIQKRKKGSYVLKSRVGKAIEFGTVGALVFTLVISLPDSSFSGKGRVEVTMLDVGQGDGLYIKGPGGRSYFIDGGSSDIASAGSYRIEPFLKSRGKGSLDYVFISHGDADHMNGIQELLGSQKLGIRIKNLVLPPPRVQDKALRKLALTAVKNGTRVVSMEVGDSLKEGDLKLQCLAPSVSYKGDTGNAASMVLALSYKEFDMLFTGDLEGEGEKLLEDDPGLKSCDVLKVAHHGSKNSTTDKFLSITKPGTAFISAGINSRYGHPHKETMERLVRAGCKIYSTSESGAVTLISDGKAMRIKRYIE